MAMEAVGYGSVPTTTKSSTTQDDDALSGTAVKNHHGSKAKWRTPVGIIAFSGFAFLAIGSLMSPNSVNNHGGHGTTAKAVDLAVVPVAPSPSVPYQNIIFDTSTVVGGPPISAVISSTANKATKKTPLTIESKAKAINDNGNIRINLGSKSENDVFSYLVNFYEDQEKEMILNAQNGLYGLPPLPIIDHNVQKLLDPLVEKTNTILKNQGKTQSITPVDVLKVWRPKQLDPDEVSKVSLGDKCTDAVINEVGSVVGIVMSSLGVIGVGAHAYANIAHELISKGLPTIDLIIDKAKGNDKAGAALSVFEFFITMLGFGAIVKLITSGWSVWEYIIDGIGLLAEVIAFFVSGGALLIIKVVLLIDALWAFGVSTIELAQGCSNDGGGIPSGTCIDVTNRFCHGSDQYLSNTDQCYQRTDGEYCWSPIKSPPSIGTWYNIGSQGTSGCGTMCERQTYVYNPDYDTCYRELKQRITKYFFYEGSNANCSEPGNRCEIVGRRAFADCGCYLEYCLNNNYFCGNDLNERNSGNCRIPTQCCVPLQGHFFERKWTCEDSEHKEEKDAMESTLPVCPIW